MPQPAPHTKFRLPKKAKRFVPSRFRGDLGAVLWRDLALAFAPLLFIFVACLTAVIWYFNPAPPKKLVLSSGPEGSTFHADALRYQAILARNGVKLDVRPSEGSLENLDRLRDDKSDVDIGFVLDGISPAGASAHLMSLGSVSHQAVYIFYRGDTPIHTLAQFAGKKISIGRMGSGSRVLALSLFKENGLTPGHDTQFRGLEAEDAVTDLLAGEIDAVFLMGDSTRPETIRQLILSPEIHAMSLSQSDAYARRFGAISTLRLPMGGFDLARNLPETDLTLIAANVELVAKTKLHPALSDLLIEAAREVHGGRNLLQDAGQFPVAQASDFPMSADAVRYYTYGKGFFYRNLPFWLASLLDRIVILILPLAVIFIPGLRVLPWLYRWRIRSRIYPWYEALISLEQGLMDEISATDLQQRLNRLEEIEGVVNTLSVPPAYIDQVYVLREHIVFVRTRLSQKLAAHGGVPPA